MTYGAPLRCELGHAFLELVVEEVLQLLWGCTDDGR